MKKAFYFLALIAFAYACTDSAKNNTVVLKGTYANYEQDTLFMKNLTSENMIYKEDIHKIPINKDAHFYYKFELDQPAYFQIGRTFLYLSPGDSLVATLDAETRRTATYLGLGAQANNYLSNVTYPKAGSYWSSNEEAISKINNSKDAPAVLENLADQNLEALEQ